MMRVFGCSNAAIGTHPPPLSLVSKKILKFYTKKASLPSSSALVLGRVDICLVPSLPTSLPPSYESALKLYEPCTGGLVRFRLRNDRESGPTRPPTMLDADISLEQHLPELQRLHLLAHELAHVHLILTCVDPRGRSLSSFGQPLAAHQLLLVEGLAELLAVEYLTSSETVFTHESVEAYVSALLASPDPLYGIGLRCARRSRERLGGGGTDPDSLSSLLRFVVDYGSFPSV